MAEQYNVSDEAIGGAVELGVVGTLLSSASSLPPALITVGRIGGAVAGATGAAAGTPIVVSLTGVVAVSTAAYVGFSLGKRVVKSINHSLNDGPESGYEGG